MESNRSTQALDKRSQNPPLLHLLLGLGLHMVCVTSFAFINLMHPSSLVKSFHAEWIKALSGAPCDLSPPKINLALSPRFGIVVACSVSSVACRRWALLPPNGISQLGLLVSDGCSKCNDLRHVSSDAKVDTCYGRSMEHVGFGAICWQLQAWLSHL